MRRITALFVIALILAVLVGRSTISTGVSVNGSTISTAELRAELSAISDSPTLQCYLTAIAPASFAAGGGSSTMAASGVAAWSNLRVEGMAIDQYVRGRLHYVPSSDLVKAKVSLELEMTQAAASNSLSCPGTAAQALAAMTPTMRDAEVLAQAESLFLVGKLNSTIPLSASALRTYFDAHRSSYDTICISVAEVPMSKVSAFAAAQAKGATVPALAKQFSVDASAARGGAYGCYGPTSVYYAAVRADSGTTAIGTFPKTPLTTSSNGVTYALYVAPTKRTPTPFAQAESAVLADVRTLNATEANTVKNTILGRAVVAVDPALGRWALGSSGLSVVAPALPSTAEVTGATTLTAPSALPYQ